MKIGVFLGGGGVLKSDYIIYSVSKSQICHKICDKHIFSTYLSVFLSAILLQNDLR